MDKISTFAEYYRGTLPQNIHIVYGLFWWQHIPFFRRLSLNKIPWRPPLPTIILIVICQILGGTWPACARFSPLSLQGYVRWEILGKRLSCIWSESTIAYILICGWGFRVWPFDKSYLMILFIISHKVVSAWNPMWPFRWKLMSRTSMWYVFVLLYVCVWNASVWPFKWKLMSSTFMWYFLVMLCKVLLNFKLGN